MFLVMKLCGGTYGKVVVLFQLRRVSGTYSTQKNSILGILKTTLQFIFSQASTRIWPQGWPPYNTFMLVFVNKSVKEQFLFLTDLLSYTKNKIIIILCANSQQLSLLII